MAQPQKAPSAPKSEPQAEQPGAPEKAKTLPLNDIKALFKLYDEKDAAVKRAEKALETAMSERSSVVEKLAEHGKSFLRDGKRLLVMSRTAKETGAKSFFFRGEGERTGIDVS